MENKTKILSILSAIILVSAILGVSSAVSAQVINLGDNDFAFANRAVSLDALGNLATANRAVALNDDSFQSVNQVIGLNGDSFVDSLNSISLDSDSLAILNRAVSLDDDSFASLNRAVALNGDDLTTSSNSVALDALGGFATRQTAVHVDTGLGSNIFGMGIFGNLFGWM